MIKPFKKITCLLIVFALLLSYSSIFNNLFLSSDNDTNLETSATNTLFNGKSYPFELNDFYDDEDLDHVWTGAKFQTEDFNDTTTSWTGVVNNDTVTPVNNTETQYGDPNNVNMISGTTDSTNNMKSNDASYTTFTSSHTDGYIYETPSQWDDFTFTEGSGDTIGELETIDTDWSVITSSHTDGYIYETPSQWSDFTFTKGTGDTIGELETIDADWSVLDSSEIGHYAGTYSFENGFADWDGYRVTLLDDLDGHKKVLDFYDDVSYGYATISRAIDPTVSYGTVESWMRTDTHTYKFYEVLYDGVVEVIYMGLFNSQWQYKDQGIWTIIPNVAAPASNTWYHVRVDFELTDGEYEGLSQYKQIITIDGVSSGVLDICNDQSSVDELFYRTDTNQLGYHCYLDAVGIYPWDPEYNVGDNEDGDPELDVQIDMHVDDPDLSSIEYFKYSHKTDISIDVDLDIWNWDTTSWYEIESVDNSANFDDDSFTLGSASPYVSGTNQVRIRFQALSVVENFELLIDRLRIDYLAEPAELNVQIDMQVVDPDFSSIEFFKYSHKTNISITVDLDIWNWDTTSWYEIESVDNSANFDDDSFTLGSASPYVNETNGVRIRFQATKLLIDFDLLIDRLRLDYLTEPAELEMTITFSFDRYNEDLLAMNLESWQKTNISQTIVFKIWNYDTESYVQISSSSDTSFTKKEYNTESPNDFISPSGVVKLYWVGSDLLDNFELQIDYLFVQIFYKLDLIHWKSFDVNGLHRYRWIILGSIQYTDWTVFEVIDPVPNFHAISESELTTRWILQGSEINGIEDFHDDISINDWNLGDVSDDSFEKYATEGMDYLLDDYTIDTDDIQYSGIHFSVGTAGVSKVVGIAWVGTHFWILDDATNEVYKYTSAGVYTGTHFDISSEIVAPNGLGWDGTHFWVIGSDEIAYKYTYAGVYTTTNFDISVQDNNPYGITWDGTHLWVVGEDTDEVYKYTDAGVYTGTHFDISSEIVAPRDIVWDGTHFWVTGSSFVYKYTSAGVYTGTYFDATTEDGRQYGITSDGTYLCMVGFNNAEVYKYEFKYDIEKKYFGSGYTYIQTNETELISLKSVDYGTPYILNSGDYFEIDFETSSDSQINLILLKNDVVNKTLLLSQSGNTNFNRHTVQISTEELIEFDQLKISSIFEDTDNIKIYDIKTYKYTITGDYKAFYVSPINQRDVYLSPDTYNLRIFDPFDGDVKVNVNITIESTDYYHVYLPIGIQECRLGLFSPDDIYLPIIDYHINISRSLNGEYDDFWLLYDVFSVDTETYIYIDVYDRFNTLIDSFTRFASDYIELELETYQLQIKNLMEQKTIIDINGSYVYPLLSGNTIEFMLATSYYQIGYYDSDNDHHQFMIYLDSNQAYELNRSKICFLSYADQQGNHLFFDNYKTYINGTMIYENIFYEDAGDDVNITITDRYDYQVYSGIYSVNLGDNYIAITLTLYTLKIMNQQEVFNWINITRDPNYYESEYYWSEWIAPNEIIEFNLFSGYYKINLTDYENLGSSYYSYTLNGDDILLIGSNYTLFNVIYNIENVNTTIGNQITNVVIDLTNQNSDINNTIINIEINLDSVNSSLDTLLINQNTQLDFISNNISNVFIWLDTNFTSLQNNINVSFLDLSTDVYLINDTIYTAVIGVEASLDIINTTISGNLSIAIQQNEFLTTLFQLTMFSDLLNWSTASYNSTFIEEQIDVWSFINDFRNTSVLIELKYEGVVDELLLSAQNMIDQYLPNEDVEYRLWSIEDEEYLSNWEALPDNKTVSFGFYSEAIPKTPDFNAPVIWLMIVLIILGCGASIILIGYIAYRYRKKSENYRRSYADKITLEAKTIKKFTQGTRIR